MIVRSRAMPSWNNKQVSEQFNARPSFSLASPFLGWRQTPLAFRFSSIAIGIERRHISPLPGLSPDTAVSAKGVVRRLPAAKSRPRKGQEKAKRLEERKEAETVQLDRADQTRSAREGGAGVECRGR